MIIIYQKYRHTGNTNTQKKIFLLLDNQHHRNSKFSAHTNTANMINAQTRLKLYPTQAPNPGSQSQRPILSPTYNYTRNFVTSKIEALDTEHPNLRGNNAKSNNGGARTEVGIGVEVVVGAGLFASNHLRRRLPVLPLRVEALFHLHTHLFRLFLGVEPQPRRRGLRQAAVGVAVAALATIHGSLERVGEFDVARRKAGEEGKLGFCEREGFGQERFYSHGGANICPAAQVTDSQLEPLSTSMHWRREERLF